MGETFNPQPEFAECGLQNQEGEECVMEYGHYGQCAYAPSPR